MKKEEQALLILSARALSYPTEQWKIKMKEMNEVIEEIFPKRKGQRITNMYAPLLRTDIRELQRIYVETFDLKSNLGLYLTAYELGDSNRRGAALIKLQKIINVHGFERDGSELADYIPMLLEFLAVAPKNEETKRLWKRMSVAVSYMTEKIDRENPYAQILEILKTYVFPVPSKEEVMLLELGREKADLEELPYPIMYQ